MAVAVTAYRLSAPPAPPMSLTLPDRASCLPLLREPVPSCCAKVLGRLLEPLDGFPEVSIWSLEDMLFLFSYLFLYIKRVTFSFILFAGLHMNG